MSNILILFTKPEALLVIGCIGFIASLFSIKTLFVTMPLFSIALYSNTAMIPAVVLLVIWIFFLIAQWRVAGYSTENDLKPLWLIIVILLLAILFDILFDILFIKQFYQSFTETLPFTFLGFILFSVLLFWGIHYIICPLIVYRKYTRITELTNCFTEKHRKSTDYILIFQGERYTVDFWTYRRLKKKKGKVFSYTRCECLMGVICIRSLKQVES